MFVSPEARGGGRRAKVTKVAQWMLCLGLAGGALGAVADKYFDHRNEKDIATIEHCETHTGVDGKDKNAKVSEALLGCLETGMYHASHTVIIKGLEVGDSVEEVTSVHDRMQDDANQILSAEAGYGAGIGLAAPLIAVGTLGSLYGFAREGVARRRQEAEAVALAAQVTEAA